MAEKDKRVKRRIAGAYVSSVMSISLVLLLVGAASLIGVNARRVSDWFKENMQVEVLLREEVSEKQAEAYQKDIASLPYIKSAKIITREQGREELRSLLGEDFMDVFEGTSVPLSLEITLKADYVNADSLALVVGAMEKSPLVDVVESRLPLVDALNANLSKIALVFAVLILLLLFISFILIGNTVRLNIYARRFTVHTMQLVGASNSFIRRPFLLDALKLGLLSSLISIAVMAGGIYWAWSRFPQLFGILDAGGLAIVAGIILFTGIGICLASAFFVLGHLLAIDSDKLYY